MADEERQIGDADLMDITHDEVRAQTSGSPSSPSC
jgi:hypothetical protein